MVKTKAFAVAQSEAEPFGQLDKPDVFYQVNILFFFCSIKMHFLFNFQLYPEMYGSRPGSIASFSFRLLLSELPMHCGKPKESLTKLYSMKAIIKQVIIMSAKTFVPT